MTTILLIRHGQSTGNLIKVLCGHKDFPLTPLGEKQAECVASYLKKHYSIDRIYSSPLLRAGSTAAPTSRELGIPVAFEPDLIEICAGVWEGLGWDELHQKYDEEHQRWLLDGDFCPEGGEPIRDFCKRVTDCFQRLAKRHNGECVALFCHSGAINRIYLSLIHTNPSIKQHEEKYVLTNGSVTAVELDETGYPVAIPLFNYSGHLKDIFSTTPEGDA